jgi:(1->4)-alpha-D-glucan 1-alpha-D-glucosylmutase
MKEPRATLRLQFNGNFRFDDAFALIPYFRQLGISHLYASPVLTARPGSTYGYDMVDPGCINPELGGEEGLRNLANALHEHNIGLIVDFVPNHMAVGGSANPWWQHVLEWGQLSPYSRFFDINWNSQDPLMKGQLLLPFLSSDYGDVLVAGKLTLQFSANTGGFYVKHYDHHFPLFPPTYADILERSQLDQLMLLGREFKALKTTDPDLITNAALLQEQLRLLAEDPDIAAAIELLIKDFTVAATEDAPTAMEIQGEYSDQVKRLHQLLEQQAYRLASWRVAADDINWRRFFDVNELGALRTERGEVFEAIHAKIFALIEQGVIDGLRIDHVDGLANPRAYCRKLRRRINLLVPEDKYFPIYVEKILANDEQLPGDWLVDGTTGYEFMNQVSLLQHDPLGALQLHGLWEEITGRPASFKDEVLEARRLILSTSLAGDFESLAHQLLRVARTDFATRDLTLGAIRRTLFELIAHFPVYRTYSGACARSPQEQAVFDEALAGAKAHLQESDWPILQYLDLWLGGQPLHKIPAGGPRRLRRATLSHFQQVTSPTAAKAVEDTACYRSAVLLSRNDVGFDPGKFSAAPAQFHQFASQRAQHFPLNLLATATHDHKRGEDTRARLAVISERSVWYARKIEEWRSISQQYRKDLPDGPAPSAGDELALYQILLGSWPLDTDPEDKDGMRIYAERIQNWQEKAIREAKLRTSWVSPNGAYESACREFVEFLLLADDSRTWRADVYQAAMCLAPAGALNGLGQTLLRLTTPGIPDLYQGCDLWDFSLVDPDNRRPVDYALREAALKEPLPIAGLIAQWRNGYIKQHIIYKTLALRREHPALFSAGDYQPLEAQGSAADKVIAFIRQLDDLSILVILPRLTASLLGESEIPLIPAESWGDSQLTLPESLQGRSLTSVFTGTVHSPRQGPIAIGAVLEDFPLNLFYLSP